MKLRAYLTFLNPGQQVVVKDVYSYIFAGSAMACLAKRSLWDREVLSTREYGEETHISLRVRPKRGIINE